MARYVFKSNKENSVPFWSSSKQSCGNSNTREHDAELHIVGNNGPMSTHEVQQGA